MFTTEVSRSVPYQFSPHHRRYLRATVELGVELPMLTPYRGMNQVPEIVGLRDRRRAIVVETQDIRPNGQMGWAHLENNEIGPEAHWLLLASQRLTFFSLRSPRLSVSLSLSIR